MTESMGEKPLLNVLRGVKASRRPIWFMRQAGRYLPEYRSIRERAGSFLDLCYDPVLASDVTLQPLRRFDLDAAILFADILVVPHAMGVELRFGEGEGPILSTVRDERAVGSLRPVNDARQSKMVCETVSLVRERLERSVSLIGFCGGPWTVACYMIEGKSSDWQLAKIAAYRREAWFLTLIEKLIGESVEYLSAQITAGAEVVQVFDSWAGELAGELRREFVVDPLARITQRLKERHPTVPVILFARGLGTDHRLVVEASGCDAVGLETGLSMSWASENICDGVALQGNLDPCALLAGDVVAVKEAVELAMSVSRHRHIFNLGHGIKVGTQPETIEAVVSAVRKSDEKDVTG